MSVLGGGEFQSVFASGLGRRKGREEKGCSRRETRRQDGVTVQMPNPLLDCKPFFPNKHNSHTEDHSWQLMAQELPGLDLSASQMFTDGPDLYVSEVPGQSALTCPDFEGYHTTSSLPSSLSVL